MASLDHRLNPLSSIKECMTCGALYTADFCCSKGGLEDKILVPKPPQNCATCGNPVDGFYCRSCAFVRKCLNEGWYTIHDENKILDTSKSSRNNTNVVSTPQEPIVFNQDPDENSLIYNSKPNSFNDSPSVLTHPPQLQFETYFCEICGNNAHYGYDCPPQFPLVYEQEPCHNQNFNDNYFPQNSQSSSQQFNCCENCGGPHATFQCQPMNEEYYERNSCYYPNSFGFDQYQPPQFPVNYPPQKTSKEILQAQEDLMEAIQSFLNKYDHIPPNEKCMALLLAEERFLKIKQVMREEQNQPEVMQELLLKLMDDLQIFKGNQQEKKEMATQSLIPYWNSSMIDDEVARDNFLKDVCTFLRKFSRIPFGVTPKVILIAWESFGKIKDALMDKQYRQEDIQELMSKLLEDVLNISEEFSEYINCPSWNRPLFYFDDDDDEYTVIWRRPKAITPDEPSKEPEDTLIKGGKELSTIPEKDNQDIPITSPKIDFLSEEFIGEFTPIPPGMDEDEFDEEEVDCYDYDISSDDDSYENIEYVEASLLKLEYDNEDQEKKEFDLEYNSLPEFETFSYHTEETRSGSTTTHVNNFLPEYDSFLF
ncbi:hypothetical protein Tco_0679425 [Tanacetum coccineum]|uniref:CCHC-type domain-containing protein n=1 Tax=Tanacetum coccineum TaxID=301880 RepID=A0ABQ4XJ43_9ASTR